MPAYLKLAGINGPANTAGLTLPAGLSLAGSFVAFSYTFGVALPTDLFDASSTAAVIGRASPSGFAVQCDDTPAMAQVWKANHTGLYFASVVLAVTQPASGGLTTGWVSSYWMLSGCVVTGVQTQWADLRPQIIITLAASKITLAEFADPVGGLLPVAAPLFTWDYTKNAPVA